jgi:hypothetical protein
MNTALAAICSIPGAGRVMTPRRANARLARGGRNGPRERDTWAAYTPLAGEAARWQLILDLLDPDKRCGAWSPATVQGRPVVCTPALRIPLVARLYGGQDPCREGGLISAHLFLCNRQAAGYE